MLTRSTIAMLASAALLVAAAQASEPKLAPADLAQSGADITSPDADAPVWKLDCDPVTHAAVMRATPDRRIAAPTATRGRALAFQFLETGLLPEGDAPTDVAFTPDGTKFVIAHRDTNNLIVYDAATRAFLQEINLSGSPAGLAISSDGVHAVTANLFEDTASIVDLTTGLETAVVPVGDQPGVVRITPDGLTAVVGNTVDGTLSVIDIGTATELRRILGADFTASLSVNFEPGAVATSFSNFELIGNTTVIHPNFTGDQISFFDIATGDPNHLPSAGGPRNVAVTPDGTKAVVSHPFTGNTISVVDPTTRTITKTIAIGATVFGPISIRPNGIKSAVAVQNAVRVVNLNTDAVSTSLSTASVNQLLTTANEQYALAVGFFGSLIQYSTNTVLTNLNNIVSTSFGAVSPVDERAVMVANLFGEDQLVVNTNGASGFLEGQGPSGPAPEADATRTVAISADGSIAVAVNLFSDTASIIDLNTRTVLDVVSVGDRPSEVEITPDGSKAVVANLDSTFASIIDLTTHAVTNVSISRRAGEVEIAPDGSFAYLAVVASGDGVWRIDLNTLTTTGGKLLTGNMGGAGFLHNQTSGMTLSHDGATLVTCGSFDNNVSIIDTAAWSELARVPVGTFPVRATFSADDATVYISNKNDDTISVVTNAGAASAVTATVNVGDQPFEIAVEPNAPTLYVLNFGVPSVGVVDLNSNVMTGTIALPNFPGGIHLDSTRGELYVPTGTWSVSFGPGPLVSIARSGEFNVIDTQTLAITEQTITGHPPSDLFVNEATGLAAVPSPFDEGLLLIDVVPACPGDVDGNVNVNISDLGIVLSNFGLTPADPSQGDVDDDDDVDITDLGIVLANFGTVCP